MANIEEEVARLIEIASHFERSKQLIDVAKYEISELYMNQLRESLGEESPGFIRLLGMAARISQDGDVLMARVNDMRMLVLQIASATSRGR